MKRKTIWLVILILAFGVAGYAQKEQQQKRKKAATPREPVWNVAELSFDLSDLPLKINAETTKLPKDFYGHNFINLFANLEKVLKLSPPNAAPEEKYRFLKNKKILGNLTVDDYFIFKVQRNSDVRGYSKDLSRRFSAVTFQLRPEPRIEATTDWVGTPCGVIGAGMAPPTGDAPEDFIKTYTDDSIWEKSYLLINTLRPIYNRKNYKGKPTDEGEICPGKILLPGPQAQYEIRFARPQRFEIAKSETASLSLKDYEYEEADGIGVIAWHEKGDKLPLEADDYAETYFVVKLAAPFIKSEILTAQDEIEKREFKMFSRAFYADIESIWIVGNKTGKIVKKIEKLK